MEEETSSVENLKDRIRSLEDENFKLSNNFLINQYNQLKNDVRDIDKLIWATPIVVGIITAAILAISFSSLFEDVLLPIKVSGVVVGIVLNFILYVGLCKNRFFQVYKNNIIDDLERRMPIVNERKNTGDVWKQTDYETLSGFVHKFPVFLLITGSVILFISSLVGAIIFLVSENFPNSGIGIIITIILLGIISRNNKRNKVSQRS